MEIDELERLIRLLKDEALSEITLWEGDRRITVRQATPRPSDQATQGKAPDEARDTGAFTVNAPLVGTFHRRPSPDAAPFVGEGDLVRSGDTLCLIEAMKVMNEIQAEKPGRVERILAEDGQTVDYGQALFRIAAP
ncbi:MAG: acetyl-CoA carboxylase, biotin carboxyl carrier protein [Candidatus Bipolaricaulota bacterium]|jgi:acetyl-CoA carboxylase biotin carboxyl carrier protein|nr:acetyl-CoA carboxylase, biotin carboxyl carrier protein [Candidatus Bipolaricaulota bacterium]